MNKPCKNALFELYFQRNPRGGGFTVFSGLGAALDIMARAGFDGKVRAVPEGMPVFPGEPVLTTEGEPAAFQEIAPEIERAMREACERATVTARLSLAAEGSEVQIGAQTPSNAFVQCFENESAAFEYLCGQNRNASVLPVDTHSTLQSGIPGAIEAFKACPRGQMAVKISTGDIAYQAIHARKLLDEAGLTECKIHAGGALDEFLIRDIRRQGAPLDVFCVDRLPACNDFRMSFAVSGADGEPRMTRSQNVDKITPPGRKQIWRVLDEDGKALADLLTLKGEVLPVGEPYTLFDPHHPWKKRTVESLNAIPLLLTPHSSPLTPELWDEVLRFENPHKYYVDYSQCLWELFRETMG